MRAQQAIRRALFKGVGVTPDNADLVAAAGLPVSGTWSQVFTQQEQTDLIAALKSANQWLMPRRASTLKTATDGSGSVPAVGDPIGRMVGQSTSGLSGSAPADTNRPLLQSDSGLTYAAFDDVNDQIALGVQTGIPLTADTYVVAKGPVTGTGAIIQDSDGTPFWGDYQSGSTATSTNISSTNYIDGTEAPTRDDLYVALNSGGRHVIHTRTTGSWPTNIPAPILGGSTIPSGAGVFEVIIMAGATQYVRDLIGRYLKAANGTANRNLFVAAANTGREVDIVLVIGQSNARGTGVSGTSPAVTVGAGYSIGSAVTKRLIDPVGWDDFKAQTGSAWPGFANDWYTRTSRTTIFVPCAVGGTALVTGSPRWAVGGDLRANAKHQMALAEDLVATLGVTVVGRYAVWSLGETDGDAGVSQAAMESALGALVDEFVTDLSLTKFVISRLGTRNDGTKLTEYAAIRAAQEAVCAARPTTTLMGFRGAIAYLAAGKMADTYHYTQPGYDQMGAALSTAIATNTADPEP